MIRIFDMKRMLLSAGLVVLLAIQLGAAEPDGLKVTWKDRYLTIHGAFPGDTIRIHYLEAYCRPGSTDRDWKQTVIPHQSRVVEATTDRQLIVLRDELQDGVIVNHRIVAHTDAVEFQLTAHNPTSVVSAAHWAQPCIRVDQFTGAGKDDARDRVPRYARQCFLFIDDKQVFLPTQPWAHKARYVYGQVYVPNAVDRNDVNPRPVSSLIPSNGLCGCVSADGTQLMAVAWEPYQEIFQGVIACIHNDFRIGGLHPGETKQIKGMLYVMPNDVDALLARYERDF